MAEMFNFALVLAPLERALHQVEDALFESGCDDAILRFHGNTPVLEFDRESVSLQDAIVSALHNAVDAGVDPLRIEPDDLVSAAEISRRAGVTREAVRLWADGLRGDGFPSPRAIVGKSKVWSWLHVAKWLAHSRKLPGSAVDAAAVVAGFNLA